MLQQQQIEGSVISLENTGENDINGWKKGEGMFYQTVGSLGQGFYPVFAQQGG